MLAPQSNVLDIVNKSRAAVAGRRGSREIDPPLSAPGLKTRESSAKSALTMYSRSSLSKTQRRPCSTQSLRTELDRILRPDAYTNGVARARTFTLLWKWSYTRAAVQDDVGKYYSGSSGDRGEGDEEKRSSTKTILRGARLRYATRVVVVLAT